MEQKARIDHLKDEFDHLFLQLGEIKVINDDLIYLHPEEGIYNKSAYPSENGILSRLIHGLKIEFALKYMVFLNDRENHNLISFIQNLIRNFECDSLTDRIKLDDLKGYLSKLKRIKNSNEYKVLYHLRNKHFAHLDKNRNETHLPVVNQVDISKQIDHIIEIFKTIGSALFATHYSTEVRYLDRYLLQEISVYYDMIDFYNQQKHREKSTTIDLESIRKILKK
jgi:plasmid maintenance system killer protein